VENPKRITKKIRIARDRKIPILSPEWLSGVVNGIIKVTDLSAIESASVDTTIPIPKNIEPAAIRAPACNFCLFGSHN
jgi:hypothetical protein